MVRCDNVSQTPSGGQGILECVRAVFIQDFEFGEGKNPKTWY